MKSKTIELSKENNYFSDLGKSVLDAQTLTLKEKIEKFDIKCKNFGH